MKLAFALWLCAATAAQADHLFDGRDLGAGERLYMDHCASCHGSELEGQPNWQSSGPDGTLPAPPHDERGHTWHHDTALLLDYTLLGGQATLAARGVTGFKSGMPGFEGTLTEAEALNILAFIRSSWSERAKEVQRLRSHPEG
ncbi:c-type cytochrome [Sulfitobacter sp. BDSS02]|nr:c-type cytochrome [Sulfitobacter sp. BDSS02]MBR9851888.1 cytochrome c [Paracoccaceae bacterium]